MRYTCPACIADGRKESPGDAFVLGMVLANRTHAICRRHGNALLTSSTGRYTAATDTPPAPAQKMKEE